ncbi:MAG: aminotransferase class I/II-fold pyridoxal phosphate-dependent enzyme [Gemmobacter sp.]|uniref:aminotransferase class I/II-fold pyridoxal phosphate-dependent enzyme n=1 Tax=Gemmobacter sp. TaxID=1898957 RepID=UPI001A3B3BC6|nr:aminotransferase class I/II-fold pyridoxal phosphate-dependent enzyme [Gemmobacter sp.]MBL8563212.1 aminotransferase class I/II-fold pyridoxal phosphate-dependent enzyme [Gemmobacter sp.]
MSLLAAQRGLLQALDQRGRRRALHPVAGLDFASNDYLGLAGSDLLRDLTRAALERGHPPGAGAARLLRGNHDAFTALEQAAAAHFGSGAALYFAAGYSANLAIFSVLPAARDLVLHDALIHASARDGLRLGAAEARAFAHNDVQSARDTLRNWRAQGGKGQVWLAVESLYSMDGDFAPLADLAALAAEEQAFLIVDEAHATGLWGPEGRGLAAPFADLENVITLHTCGKALGVQGALVCAAPVLVALLVNRARSFIYSTAPSPLLAEVLRGVLAHLEADPSRRLALLARVAQAGDLARGIGLVPSGSQIQPVILPGDAACLAAAATLQAQGFDIRAIRAPTVPKGAERLRLSLTLNPPASALPAALAALEQVLA